MASTSVRFASAGKPPGSGVRFKLEVVLFNAMELSTILNQCYPQPGFVYEKARFKDKTTVEVPIRPRKGSKARCSGCEEPMPGYDTLAERRFEFIPMWGMLVFFLYCSRRVECRSCSVAVEKLPWSEGKHHSTIAHMLFLAHWRAN